METPVPKIPFEETPAQLDKITPNQISLGDKRCQVCS